MAAHPPPAVHHDGIRRVRRSSGKGSPGAACLSCSSARNPHGGHGRQRRRKDASATPRYRWRANGDIAGTKGMEAPATLLGSRRGLMSDQQRKSLKPVPAARGVLFLFFIVARPFPRLLGSLLLLLSGLSGRPLQAAAPVDASSESRRSTLRRRSSTRSSRCWRRRIRQPRRSRAP
jgi:hypothetical protein